MLTSTAPESLRVAEFRRSIFRKPFTLVVWLVRFIAIYLAVLLIIVGALLLGRVVLPLRAKLFGTPSLDESRRLVSRAVRCYLWILDRSGLLHVEYQGFDADDAQQAVVFVANHPSLFDVLFFIARYPSCACIVKEHLCNRSPYSAVIRWAQYLVHSRVDLIDAAKQELSAGRPIVIFPEGTRSDAVDRSNPLKKCYQRGAAAIAIRSAAELRPVVIHCDPPALGKKRAWYQVPMRKCQVRLTLYPAVDSCCGEAESEPLAARRLTAQLEGFFEKALG